jgi:hypothetical protein
MSSKRRLRRKGCAGKTRHETREAARAHLLELRRPWTLNVYPCRYCGGFHVGHKPHGRRKDWRAGK